MKSYENALRNECGYKGAQPYVFLLEDDANILGTNSGQLLGLDKRCRRSEFVRVIFDGQGYGLCFRISKSPIWNPVTGFGGDGVPGTYTVPTDPDPTNSSKIFPQFYHGCIKDGPFANYTLKSGPGLLVTEHCLTRGINDASGVYINSSAVAYTLSLPTFEQFRVALEGIRDSLLIVGPHGGGHIAVGGEMTNYFSSPAGK